MLRRVAARLTYANVMATGAMFVALGGTSYAVAKLPKGSVGAEQLRTGAVTENKVANGAISAAKLAPGVSLSGPRGPRGVEGPVGPAGPTGAPGAPATIPLATWRSLELAPGWANYSNDFAAAGFSKDASGRVFLRGLLTNAPGGINRAIGILPEGYRPQKWEIFPALGGGDTLTPTRVDIFPSGVVYLRAGDATPSSFLSLGDISFSTQ
ncbi:MAG: hypothetical protein PGN13_00250 [Patulibacter minatonensis]